MGRINIIQVNYGRYDLTEESLASVYLSEGVDYRVMLVDILPVPHEVEKLKKRFPELQHLPLPENRGYGDALNRGIKVSLKEGVTKTILMNNDLFVEPDTIRLLDEASGTFMAGVLGPLLISSSQRRVISSAGIYVNRASGRTKHQLIGRPIETIPPSSAPYEVPAISGAMMMVKTEVFLKIGLFSTDYFMYFEDIDFCLRASRGGYKVLLVPGAKAYHRGGGTLSSPSKKIFYSTRNQLIMADRNLLPSWGFIPLLRRFYIGVLNLSFLIFKSESGLLKGLPEFIRGIEEYRKLMKGKRPRSFDV